METKAQYLTVQEVAVELGVHEQTVRIALLENRLPFVMMLGRKAIGRADLDAYKQRTRPNGEKPRGRPRGAKNQPKD
ncbi:MAG: excisionase family DNA-binding protein [Janthinobacterium lividum]